MSKYVPPKQSAFGQLVDCVLILVMVFASLMGPLILAPSSADQSAAASGATQTVTWSSIGVSKVEAQQWQKLGYKPADAKPIVETKFDYAVDPKWLILTIVVILGYYAFMLKMSEKEYREVIHEKFDNGHHRNVTDLSSARQ